MHGPAGAVGLNPSRAVCDVSVTNVRKATCDFCCLAYDKQSIKDRSWLDPAQVARGAVDHLR
jgi:hypothetical protein